MLTPRQIRELAHGFAWLGHVPLPIGVKATVRIQDEATTLLDRSDPHGWTGAPIFTVHLHGACCAVAVSATTPASALCQALGVWGRQHKDPGAEGRAVALRRRLTN